MPARMITSTSRSIPRASSPGCGPHCGAPGRKPSRPRGHSMIKYLGSKRLLVPRLVDALTAGGARTALDLFSGTSRVGHALKRAGLRVHANDHNAYAHAFARCYVAADARRWRAPAPRLIVELDAQPGGPRWFTATYAARSPYPRPHNAPRVEAIRPPISPLPL